MVVAMNRIRKMEQKNENLRSEFLSHQSLPHERKIFQTEAATGGVL